MGVFPKWVKPMALGESDIVLESNPFMPFYYSRIWNWGKLEYWIHFNQAFTLTQAKLVAAWMRIYTIDPLEWWPTSSFNYCLFWHCISRIAMQTEMEIFCNCLLNVLADWLLSYILSTPTVGSWWRKGSVRRVMTASQSLLPLMMKLVLALFCVSGDHKVVTALIDSSCVGLVLLELTKWLPSKCRRFGFAATDRNG